MNLKAAAVLAVVASACWVGPHTVSPKDFASVHGKDARAVVVAVQEVESDAAIMAVSREAGPDTRASFDGVIDGAKSVFDTARHNLFVDKPAGLEQSDHEMWAATDELSSAMKALRAFMDDGKPSELTDYKKRWNQGLAWWNQAVTAIWQAADKPAPTVANAPPAPHTV